MLGPDQAYEGLYGQGPPSVHSSHGGRAFQQGKWTEEEEEDMEKTITDQNT